LWKKEVETIAPTHLEPRGDGPAPLVFRQGSRAPYAVRWYGVTSLFGHFRNFIARAIASESVDSRDWMRPLEAADLLRNAIRVLGGNEGAPSLVEALGRPMWLDFVADTGDDRDVSQAVGRMVADTYTVAGQGDAARTLPRGEVLLFGGDTAYPVSTADEIDRRVVQPWNEALRELEGGVGPRSVSKGGARARVPRRVLLGIPGNHDWYDGLDGFARLFRRNMADLHRSDAKETTKTARKSRRPRRVGAVARELHLDEVGGIFRLMSQAGKSVRAFFKGVGVARAKRLQLTGYEPVQESSYWVLPLARGVDLWGVDRQLGNLDYRQRQYFQRRRASEPERAIVFVAPDPAIGFGEPWAPGQRMLRACRLSLDTDPLFYLTGDLHHYERREHGRSLHVIAGGGGAFLHGTRISPAPLGPAKCAYPTAGMTRQLVAGVPLNLMLGRGGFLPHIALALVASLELGAALGGGTAALVGSAIVVTLAMGVAFYLIAGHQRAHPRRIAAASVPFAAALGLSPMLLKLALPRVVPTLAGDTAVLVAHALLGTFVFGLFLASVATLGLEQQQAFAALSHPGFKHFVRFCVHPDGKMEAWVIGKDDPLVPGPPKLVDRFEWSPTTTRDGSSRTQA
jgi:hypothetical protein